MVLTRRKEGKERKKKSPEKSLRPENKKSNFFTDDEFEQSQPHVGFAWLRLRVGR
jgi:hypothetical protein